MSQPSAPKVLLIESHFDAAWQDFLPEDTSACRLLTACVPVPGSSGFSMHIFHNVFLAAFCCHMEKLLKTDVPQELLTQDEMLSNLCRVEECRVWRLKSAAIKQQFRRYKQTSFRRFSKSNFRLEKRENTLLKMIHNVSKFCCYTSLLLGERSVHCKMLIFMSFKGCFVRAFCINYHLQVPTGIFPL